MKRNISLLIFLPLLFFSSAMSQITTSAYSRYGIGEPVNANSSRYFSMGGLSVGTFGRASINKQNPASYTDIGLTTLEFSTISGFRFQKQGDQNVTLFQSTVNKVGFAFPSNKSFAMAAGFSPYTGVGYSIMARDSLLVDGEMQSYLVNYQGNGSINEFYIGGAFSLFDKLRLGVNMNIYFGTIDYTTISQFINTGDFAPIIHNRQLTAIGVNPDFGVQYEDTLKLKVKVDQYKVIKRDMSLIEAGMKELQNRKNVVLKKKSKLELKKEEVELKKNELESSRNAVLAQLDAEREANVAKTPSIKKLERQSQKLIQRRKKINMKFQTEYRKNRDELAIIDLRLNKSLDIIGNKQEEMTVVLSDSSKRYTMEKKKLLYRVGAVFQPGLKLFGEELNEFDNIEIGDTIGGVTKGKIRMPMKYGLGFSLTDTERWSVGVDVLVQNWSSLQVFDRPSQLNNVLSVNVGGEWIPSKYSRDYIKRIAWRAGAFYQTGMLNIKDSQPMEYGVTFGAGFPLRRGEYFSRLFSRINLGVKYVHRGTTNNGLMRENMVLINLGVKLLDRWFVKPKIK